MKLTTRNNDTRITTTCMLSRIVFFICIVVALLATPVATNMAADGTLAFAEVDYNNYAQNYDSEKNGSSWGSDVISGQDNYNDAHGKNMKDVAVNTRNTITGFLLDLMKWVIPIGIVIAVFRIVVRAVMAMFDVPVENIPRFFKTRTESGRGSGGRYSGGGSNVWAADMFKETGVFLLIGLGSVFIISAIIGFILFGFNELTHPETISVGGQDIDTRTFGKD